MRTAAAAAFDLCTANVPEQKYVSAVRNIETSRSDIFGTLGGINRLARQFPQRRYGYYDVFKAFLKTQFMSSLIFLNIFVYIVIVVIKIIIYIIFQIVRVF